jgi:hypothetical protein
LEVEKQMKSALEKLTGDLAGTYTTLSDISPEKQAEMVKNHQLFHNNDPLVFEKIASNSTCGN